MYLKILKKTLRYGLVFIGLLIAGLFLWLNFGIYTFTDSKEREQIIKDIKASPELPEHFITIYAKLNQSEMSNSVFTWFIHGLGSHYGRQPDVDAAAYWAISHCRGEIRNIATLAFYLERNVSKEESLRFVLSNTDFTHNCIGVKQAAQYYFQKPLATLKDDEIIGLIAMCKNPSLYNPRRKNGEIYRDRVATLKQVYENTN